MAFKKNKAESKVAAEIKSRVVLKNYSKIILSYPLFIYTIIAWIVQFSGEKLGGDPKPQLAVVWMFIFFMNFVIIGFDFPTIKFFVLFLLIVVAIMALVLLNINGIINLASIWDLFKDYFDYTINTKFYGWMTLTIGIVLLAAILQAQLNFVKIEKNEIYVRGLSVGKSERFSTTSLQIDITISDVFEYMSIGAGTVTLKLANDRIIILQTVPFVRKKKRTIDTLLSTTLVESK